MWACRFLGLNPLSPFLEAIGRTDKRANGLFPFGGSLVCVHVCVRVRVCNGLSCFFLLDYGVLGSVHVHGDETNLKKGGSEAFPWVTPIQSALQSLVSSRQ